MFLMQLWADPTTPMKYASFGIYDGDFSRKPVVQVTGELALGEARPVPVQPLASGPDFSTPGLLV